MSIKCQHADEYRVRSTEYRHLITNPYPKQNALSVDLRLQRYCFFWIYANKITEIYVNQRFFDRCKNKCCFSGKRRILSAKNEHSDKW